MEDCAEAGKERAGWNLENTGLAIYLILLIKKKEAKFKFNILL